MTVKPSAWADRLPFLSSSTTSTCSPAALYDSARASTMDSPGSSAYRQTSGGNRYVGVDPQRRQGMMPPRLVARTRVSHLVENGCRNHNLGDTHKKQVQSVDLPEENQRTSVHYPLRWHVRSPPVARRCQVA